jgi:hypothetical protein
MKRRDHDQDLAPVRDLLAGLPIELRNVRPVSPPNTRAQRALVEASVAINLDPLDVDAAFLARQLVQCTLPHANPGDVPFWRRRNGTLTLGIQAGMDFRTGTTVGYPYGSIPRLLLFWLNREAVQTRSRRIQLGRSLAHFMRDLGLDPSRGGKRSDAFRLKDQMKRLFRARISFDQALAENGREGERWLDMQVAPKGELWWDDNKPLQDDLWESWIELGEEFYTAIIASPVPVDMRALKALKRSPLALDLYAWATHKAPSVARKGKQQFIPWASLSEQFGTDYADHLDFKKKAKAALRKVKLVYPGLRYAEATGGVLILPTSLPAVPMKPRALPKG